MLARLLALVACMAGMTSSVSADNSFTLGSVTFSVPQGWSQIDAADDHLTFGTPEGRQRATVSIMHCGKAPSFPEFQLLCSHRYDTEKDGIKDLVLIPKDPDPKSADGQFTMHFSGEENPRTRVFAGFLWVKGQDLITVYVEGIGVPAERNSDSFHEIVKSLK